MEQRRLSFGRQFFTFGLVGGIGLAVNLLVTYAFVTYGHLWYFLAFCIAAIVSWTVQFLGNSLFTFSGHGKEQYFRRYVAYLSGYVGAFFVNAALVFILTSMVGVQYLVSIALSALCTAFLTFSFSKKFVYHGRAEDK